MLKIFLVAWTSRGPHPFPLIETRCGFYQGLKPLCIFQLASGPAPPFLQLSPSDITNTFVAQNLVIFTWPHPFSITHQSSGNVPLAWEWVDDIRTWSVRQGAYVFVHMQVCLHVCLSVCLCVCLSVVMQHILSKNSQRIPWPKSHGQN